MDDHVENDSVLALKTLFEEFMYDPQNALRRHHGSALDNSRTGQSHHHVDIAVSQGIPFSLEQVILYREECAQHFAQIFGMIIKVLSPGAGHSIEDAEWRSGQ